MPDVVCPTENFADASPGHVHGQSAAAGLPESALKLAASHTGARNNQTKLFGNSGSLQLAQDVQLGDIPVEGYAIRSVNGQTSQLTPFSRFKVHGEIGLLRSQEFELRGHFRLGKNSEGIDPSTQDAMFEVGSFNATIPAGSFSLDRDGAYVFKGTVNKGVWLEVEIKPLTEKRFAFRAKANNVSISRKRNAINVVLTVGNDGGRAPLSTFWDQ